MPTDPDTTSDHLATAASEVADETSPNPEAPPQRPVPILPRFTPVPRLCDRSNGWKPAIQRAFIEALAETGSVRAACRRVGRADRGAYQLRCHPEADEFRAAWDAALDLGIRRIEDAAMDRALYGVEETYFYHGELRGRRRRFNEGLVMFMLRNRAPQRYTSGGARSLSAIDRHVLARLKREWRAEWERETHETEDETLESIDRFIDDMRDRRHANMSPRARAAWEEFNRIEAEDGTAWMLEQDDEAEAGLDQPALPPPPDPSAEPEPEPEPDPSTGPRIRTIKGDWE